MTAKEWLTSDAVIEKSKRPYAHFDYRTNIKQQLAYISNSENIKRHGFCRGAIRKHEKNK